jgi:hypothetical protein
MFSRHGLILWLRFLAFSIFPSVYVVGKAGLDLAETMLWEVCLALPALSLNVTEQGFSDWLAHNRADMGND